MSDMVQALDQLESPHESPRTTQSSRRCEKQRRMAKAKTTLCLAHPPPVKHKHLPSIRPRLLLQLHQISMASRPVPVLDILPSVHFAPKFARRFPRLLKGKDCPGTDDLLVVKSQKYDALENELDDHGEGHRKDERELVAAIHQTQVNADKTDSKAEIIFNDGRSCEASTRRNGRYDFTIVDESGLRTTARWVPKHATRAKRRNGSAPEPEEAKHTFSLIDPNSRRHPVIACLNNRAMEIYDRYSPPQAQRPPKSPSPSDEPTQWPQEEDSDDTAKSAHTEPETVEVDESLRTLIIVSGIWVAFQEGYSNLRSGHRLFTPVTAEPRSPRINGSRSTSSPTTPIASRRDQSSTYHSMSTGLQSADETTGLKHSIAMPARPAALTTRATSTRILPPARIGSDGTGSSSDGNKQDRRFCPHSSRGKRRNTMSSLEMNTITTKPLGPHEGKHSRKTGLTRQLLPLPEEDHEHVARPSKIKRLFSFHR